MILCDIGNTSYHFFKDGVDFKENTSSFEPSSLKGDVYYICVNPSIKKKISKLRNWIDISKFVDMQEYYESMGVDRIFALEAIDEGIVVDAGSAVTVDVKKEGVFLGGFIYPGIKAMQKSYANISPALDYSFNFECDLDIMPKNSQDAITYGYLKTLQREVLSYGMDIILTGGDAQMFSKVFKDATLDTMLIFKGMKKIMKKADLC